MAGRPDSVPQYRDWIDSFMVAACAKLFAASLTYPHEVIRTRLREHPLDGGKSKYTGIVQCAKLIYKEEGMGALYGGMATHMIRVVPNAAIMFTLVRLLLPPFDLTLSLVFVIGELTCLSMKPSFGS